MSVEYIYLLQTKRCISLNKNIYKIGKTTQQNLKRFGQYEPDSVLLHQTVCINCTNMERILLNIFTNKFKRVNYYGNEYFQGDWMEMRRIINIEIEKELNKCPPTNQNQPVQITNNADVDKKYIQNLNLSDVILDNCFR